MLLLYWQANAQIAVPDDWAQKLSFVERTTPTWGVESVENLKDWEIAQIKPDTLLKAVSHYLF